MMRKASNSNHNIDTSITTHALSALVPILGVTGNGQVLNIAYSVILALVAPVYAHICFSKEVLIESLVEARAMSCLLHAIRRGALDL